MYTQTQSTPVEVEVKKHKCNLCDEVIVGNLEEHEGDRFCEGCYMENFFSCYSCHEVNDNDYRHYADDNSYCEDCFYEHYSTCNDCGEAVHNDWVHWLEDTPYCESCLPDNDLEEEFRCKNIPSSSMKSEHFDLLDVRTLVGIEIECMYEDYRDVYTPSNWSRQYDGSINREDGYDSVELVSSPADGNYLWETINNAIRWRDSMGAIVNRSCGLHVHFNSLEFNARQVAMIALVYKKFEEMLKGMMPKSRQNSNWCRDMSLDYSELLSIREEQDLIDRYYGMMDSYPSTDKYNDARYCGMNIHSRYFHGTIEFRLHSGTINREKITNWIKILNKIVVLGLEINTWSKDEVRKWIDKPANTLIDSVFGSELCRYITKRTRKFF